MTGQGGPIGASGPGAAGGAGGAGAAFAWGLFLASSWTWCIGMFLPILLLREWGWAGFAVFALPNVLGCAGFGAVLDRGRAARLRARLAPCMAWFSLATIAFQTFFLSWASWRWIAPVLAPGAEPWSSWMVGAVVAAAPVLLVRRQESRAWVALGVVAWIGSMLLWSRTGVSSWSTVPAADGDLTALALLALPIAVGFLLCPALDLTFHRALEESPSRGSFAVFGLAFAPMILFAAATWGGAGPAVTSFVALQWFMQASFTAAAHAREVRERRIAGAPGEAGVVAAVLLGAVLGCPSLGGEPLYLRFLGLYGIVFPGLLLLGLRGRGGLLSAAFLVAAIPCYEAGFVGWGVGPETPTGPRLAWAPLVALGVLAGIVLPSRDNGRGAAAEPQRSAAG